MTTLVQFTPSTSRVFTFSPTISGVQYNASVPANMFGQRYYLNLTDVNQNPVTNIGIVGTGPSVQASMVWNQLIGIAVVTTAANHNVPLGSLAAVRISGTNTSFDGNVSALSTGPTTLTYALLANPSVAMPVAGQVNFDINLLAGLMTSAGAPVGWLIYHEEISVFEFD